MPTTHAAEKYLRKSKKLALKNAKFLDTLQTLLKNIRKATEAKDKAVITATVPVIIKMADKAAQHGMLKQNKAARIKSRLHARVAPIVNAK